MITIAQPDSDLNTSLGRWVARLPAISDLLEEYGLNYCCRGHVSLQEACWQRQLDAPTVLTQLRRHQSSHESPALRADWLNTPLRYLSALSEIGITSGGQRDEALGQVGEFVWQPPGGLEC